jgi:hypothetical protein
MGGTADAAAPGGGLAARMNPMRKAIVLAGVILAASAGAATWALAANMPGADSAAFPATLAKARLATAKYATSLRAARADGYSILTRMIPDMGFHFMNPKVTGFDVTKPPILVYEKRGRRWQLGALEWVFTSKPKTPPLPGARYGSFAAACHYRDGTFVPAASQAGCPRTAPGTGAAFNFWHPDLVTLHLWLWYPNPSGLYASMNPLARPFNRG